MKSDIHIVIGMSVLDFSKQHMHKLNNGVMKPKYADNTRMVSTDTDIQIDLKDITN